MAAKGIRLAATVIVLARNETKSAVSGADYKVLFVKRSAKSKFMPSTYVFPGGVVEGEHDSWPSSITDHIMHTPYRSPVTATKEPMSARFGVVREAFEEAGLLLARPAGQPGAQGNTGIPWCEAHEVKDTSLRERVHSSAATFQPLCHDFKVWPEVDKLVPWSHWITPAFEGRRFDTWFYLAALKSIPSQISADASEITQTEWLTPSEALAAGRGPKKSITLPPPTTYILEELARMATIADVFKCASKRNVEAILPIGVSLDPFIGVLPGDVQYDQAAAGNLSSEDAKLAMTTHEANLHRMVTVKGQHTQIYRPNDGIWSMKAAIGGVVSRL